MFDPRMAMADRKCFDSAAWAPFLLTLLVLAAAVLVAPMPTWGFVTVSTLPDGLHGRFAPSPVQPTIRACAALAGDAATHESALFSKDKEQDGDSVLDDASVSLVLPSCPGLAPDRHLIAPFAILSHFHLRC